MNPFAGFITTDIHFFRIKIISLLQHDILWKIYQYRTFFSSVGNIKCFFDNPSKIFSFSYRYCIFTDTAGNSDNIYFLKSIVSNQIGRYLSRKTYQWNAVIIGRRNTGYQIGSSGTACHKTDTRSSGCSCITICCMHQSLFMTRKNDLNRILLIQLIENINCITTRIRKQIINPFFLKRLYK